MPSVLGWRWREALGKDLGRETKKCSERQATYLENVTDF